MLGGSLATPRTLTPCWDCEVWIDFQRGKSASQYGHSECRKIRSVWCEWDRVWGWSSSAVRVRFGRCLPTVVGAVVMVVVVFWSICLFWTIWKPITTHMMAMITYRIVLVSNRVGDLFMGLGRGKSEPRGMWFGVVGGSTTAAAVISCVAATAASVRTIPVEPGPSFPSCPQETAPAATRGSPVRARGGSPERRLSLGDFERGENARAHHRQNGDQDHFLQERDLLQRDSP